MFLPVEHCSNSTCVTTTNHHNYSTRFKLNMIINFSSLEIYYNSVIHFHIWLRVPNRSCIMCHNKWHRILTKTNTFYFTQFVLKNKYIGLFLIPCQLKYFSMHETFIKEYRNIFYQILKHSITYCSKIEILHNIKTEHCLNIGLYSI